MFMMKKILIYEYITGGGLIGKKFDHSLLPEANLIIDSLISKTNSTVNFFCDYRHKYKNNKNAILITANNHDTIYDADLINSYDYFLPICPESDLILYDYIKKINPYVNNMTISSPKTILATSDKLLLKNICNKYNISHADSYVSKSKQPLYIIKDRFGCGCNNVRVTNNKNLKTSSNRIIENYIPGDSYSVNLYISDRGYEILTINQQIINRYNNVLKLEAINVNIYPYFRNSLFKFIDEILEAVPGLKGFIGFDFIYDKEDLFLIDINPRYTTSMSVISKCKYSHILDYINVSKNEQTGSSCEIKL